MLSEAGNHQRAVLQRIRRLLDNASDVIEGRTEETIGKAIRSLVLMAWGYYDSERAPAFSVVRKPISRSSRGTVVRGDDSPTMQSWLATLDRYDYYPDSELD